MGLIVGGASTGGFSTLFMTQACDLRDVGRASPVITKAGTVTGTAGVGSSLFLQRITIPAPMQITEVDALMQISFPATNQGAGTMSRSFALFSFGNSSSLGSVCSTSGSSSWNTGTVTAGASTSLTQFQYGWQIDQAGNARIIQQPFTFAATSIQPGEYVVGQLFDFAQASSTWTLNFYGQTALITQGGTALGLSAASAFTASGSMNALSTSALAAGSVHTASTSSAISVFTAAPVAIALGKFGTSASMSVAAASSVMATATANSTATIWMNGSVAGASILSSGGLLAGSFFTASGSGAVMSSAGLAAGSFITGTTAATSFQQQAPAIFYVGTGAASTGLSGQFTCGIMSTGGIPASIALTSTAVTYTGQAAFSQPWFALVGS